MNQKENKIAVIIVTYNAMPWAEKCFSSLRSSSIPVKTFVIDNGSMDGTQDYIQKYFPEVNFTQSSENLGFGKANNLGIEKAYAWGADFFYLMNQDAWIFDNSIEQLLKANFEVNKDEIGILSPMHLDGTENNLDKHFEKYLSSSAFSNGVFSDLYFQSLKKLYKVPFVNAAHWLIPKSIILEIGGFNPYFHHGAEDYDYVNRIHFKGKKVYVAPFSKVVHDSKKKYNQTLSDKQKMKNTQDSFRMQLETKFSDPNRNLNPKRELSFFVLSILKSIILFNRKLAFQNYSLFKFFKKNFPQIQKNHAISSKHKSAFLNLSKDGD